MAKKPRSQRRKKGGGLDDPDTAGGTEGGDGGGGGNSRKGNRNKTQETLHLAEDHTISDTISTISAFDEPFNDMDDEGQDGTMDEILARNHRSGGGAGDGTETSNREMRLRDVMLQLEGQQLEQSNRLSSSQREHMLRHVFRALAQYTVGPTSYAYVLRQLDSTLFPVCWSAVRGTSSAAEQYAGCRVLEVLAVIIGAAVGGDVLPNMGGDPEHAKTLRRIVETTTRAAPVRMAALRVMVMILLVQSSSQINRDDEDLRAKTESVMEFCADLANEVYRDEKVPSVLRTTALDCWAVLASTLPSLDIAGQHDVEMGVGLSILDLLKECLESSHVELRAAAGECVALIHEARLEGGVEHADAEGGENVTARLYRKGSWDNSKFEVVMDDIKELIADLSVESGYRLNKKTKREQRAAFREYMLSIVDNEKPEEVITFRNGNNITLTSWKEIVQLNYVRQCLQGGFQTQLLANPVLHSMFGIEQHSHLNDHDSGMSQLEKRMFMSKTSEYSKTADRNRSRNRDKRENIKNHFLTADGDDL